MGRITNKPAATVGDLDSADAFYLVDKNGAVKDKQLTLGVLLNYFAASFAPASHTHPLSQIAQSGAGTGQVPKWSGAAWSPAADEVGTGGGGGTGTITGPVSSTDNALVLWDGTTGQVIKNSGVTLTSIQTDISNLSSALGGKQAADTDLTAIAGLTSAADKVPYATGSATWALADFSSFGRSLVDDADAATARATLGLAIGTDVQAYDADLAALAGLTSAADALPYFTGSGTAAVTTLTSFIRSLLDDTDAATARATLGALAATATALNALLTDTQTAGGIDYTNLAGILAGYVGDGGIPSEVADHEQIWSGEEGTWLLLPEYLRTAFDAVAMTVTAGTPDTISLDFNAGFVRTVAMVDDTDLFSLNNQSGVPRLIVAAATSGDWLFTASAISAKVGWTSTNGILVRSGERAFFVVRRVGATDYITYLGQTGNEDAPVTLSVSGGNLALDFARCPFVGVASAAGNVAFTTPSNDSGDTHPHTVLLTVTGAPRDVTAPGYTPVNFGDADTVTLPAGATGTFVFWRIGATKFCFYGGRTYP